MIRNLAAMTAFTWIVGLGSLLAAGPNHNVQLTSFCAANSCGCEQPICGCEPVACQPGCGCESEPNCGLEFVDPGCGCEVGCDGGCDSGGCRPGGCGLGSCSECDLGDPFTLFGDHCGIAVGGWLSVGYHSKANSLFNSRPEEVQLHQAWIWAEKAVDGSCGLDIGGRVDYMYGTDSQDTQAFGTDPSGWDNSWDNGPDYGRAMPQLYLEAAYGDLSVKAGHFYTIIGWEVVGAPDNFFYSHAYTMYNSEPFTHTGALATYTMSDDVSIWGGYTLGWDSGFDDNGDAFLGGATLALTDSISLIYATTAGRFGEARFNGVEKGYMHSIIADVALTDDIQYIFQSDLLDTEDANNNPVRETFGVNQYFIKTLNDCWAVGARVEWWNAEFGGAGDADIYAATLGINHKPHANVTVRPEIRWDWDNDGAGVLENGDTEQTTFGIDSVFTF
jgi:hypothetical protein